MCKISRIFFQDEQLDPKDTLTRPHKQRMTSTTAEDNEEEHNTQRCLLFPYEVSLAPVMYAAIPC